MTIKLMLYKSSKVKFDISELVKSIGWSGEVNTLGRKLEVTLQVAAKLSNNALISIEPGNMVIFYKNSNELFRGYIFVKNRTSGGEDSLTCYDQLIYLAKNKDTIFVKNKSASDIIISSLKKFKLPIGKIESTNYKIQKLLLESKQLTEIFGECLSETRKRTSKTYKIYSSKGLVYMVSRTNASKLTIKVGDIISGSREISIEDLKTHVMVEKGSYGAKKGETPYKKYVSYNNSLAAKYGIMQEVESIDEKATYDSMKKKASSLLKQLSSPTVTSSIDFIGDERCTTGNKISIYDEISGIMGTFYISSDSHEFSAGTHKMSLQLSNKLE